MDINDAACLHIVHILQHPASCSITKSTRHTMAYALKRQEMNFLNNEVQEQRIDAYVERETAVARKRVEDTETVIKQEQKDIRNTENVGLTSRKTEKSFPKMINAIRDSLSHLASSDNEKDGDDQGDEEATELGNLSEDDQPGWVMGTISRTVQDHMERFW